MSRICRFGLLFVLLPGLFILPVMATDMVTVARYASGESVPEFEESYTIADMETKFPIMGDGGIHYYLQGPVFDESVDPWNPDEDINCYPNKDMGAVRGTDVMALCESIGGAHSGDVILIRAEDGFRKAFAYENVYTPPSCQGRMVLAWEKDGQKAGAGYYDGMRLQFFADTSVNPWGEHIFGNSDMRSALPEEYWHFFQPDLPSSTGLSVQSVSRIEIYTSAGGQPPVVPAGGSEGDANVWTPATGTLTVLSAPADAAVVIDGAVSEFVTNVSIPDMPEGYYGVTVQREGYETPGEEWVWVADGSNVTASFSLTGITSPCTVVSHPSGATIAVDGVDTATTADGEPLTLITGNHTLTLTMDGYVPLEIPVRIIRDGENRVEGVLVPLCRDSEQSSLSAGPRGICSGSLSVEAAPGYPGFIAGGESVPVSLPGRDKEEITSYLLFSHGFDTASGLPAEPQTTLSSDGVLLIPRRLANARTSAGTVDQTCALFPSVSPGITLTGAGGTEDVFSLCAVVSLCERPGADRFSYAVYEGCVPADGEICRIPADTLPENGTNSLILICSSAGTDAPSIAVNGMQLKTKTSVLVPGLMQVMVVLPPGTGEYMVTAADASPGCMVRVAVATAEGLSPVSDAAETPGTADVFADSDSGIIEGIFRFFLSFFPSRGPEFTPPGGSASVPAAGSLPADAAPADDTPSPEMMSAPPTPILPAGESSPSALTGGIFVESVPSGAWISLDGKLTGKKTPSLFGGLKEGTHRIGVSSTLTGDSQSDTAWVYPGALVSVFFDFSGTLPEASVQVESGTDDPVVFMVNGKLPEQTTPAQVTITDTDSFVAVTSGGGYQSYPLTYQRGDGTLTLVPSSCGTCVVAVTSDPSGAEVFIDGVRTGKTTPSEISCLSTGFHRIACSLPGYQPDARIIAVTDISGKPDAKVVFSLTPYSNGALCVTSVPAGAKIYLHDRYTGLVTPATISGLPIGTYEIGLSSDDETIVREATVLPETVVTYEFRFKEE
ncbi:PEGA domain-containing protein [Methanogenium sp. S4BF]|uniref:PEGA domain-containing protein n=1 Tax=Methanogenium sp. S4BF TaxID=1789226 RepID=UPI0024160C48|nr:PEGA domain-containing protein [Methanogenium sp. S4BF]WFN34209.1 PEGA domain-containing protein [Methanogenium sp. S4BF]